MDLGPILENGGYGINTTDLMIFDDQRTQIFDWNQIILKDKDAAKYILGTAFHCYENTPENVINLDKTDAIDPTKYILNTENFRLLGEKCFTRKLGYFRKIW
jgi:O-glycosyl hydrolase